MKRTHLLGGIATAAVLAVGGVGIAAALPNPPAPAVAPAATSSARIGAAALAPGTALVDADGRALYLFEADQGSTSTCNGPCAQIWPPLIDGGAPTVAGDVQASLLGSTARDDGTQQITYNGHPLYYFTGDKKPGETRGQGLDRFGRPWYVLTPAGNKIDPDDPAAAPTAISGGYGY